MLEARWCSSLAKIFSGKELVAEPYKRCTALRGETASFQLAYRFARDEKYIDRLRLSAVESPFGDALTVRYVKSVPVDYPSTAFDEDYLDTKPGLYPDVLEPLNEKGDLPDCRGEWNALWFKLNVPSDFAPGKYKIKATLNAHFAEAGIPDLEKTFAFEVEVLPAVLPPQTLKYTNWFHCDCLADYYRVPVFSEEHWRIIGNYMSAASSHGMNLILTPLFTPPLDTDIGAERPTVQLVDVSVRRGKYVFGFSRLERWLKLAAKCGIRYFEMSHLFTQWGAKATPKIVATVDGKEKRIFGWDTASDSDEYAAFLEAFLPRLADFLRAHRVASRCYFHCSDEPHSDHLPYYEHASGLLRRLLPGFKFMDALTHLEYYKKGLVTLPVPLVTNLEEFVAAGVPERWTYTCCAPALTYTNRFIAMPSARNRILGMQLYYFDVKGFLHWGFDFYYRRHSRGLLNPYLSQSGEGAWPAGDPFVVYPGPDGQPLDSLRLEVFYEGFQDQRVLQLLEGKVGRAKLMALLDKSAPGGKFGMAVYPKGEKALLALREEINTLVRKAFK